MNPVITALDRMDSIAICMEAVADLLIPEPDLQVTDRDKQAVLWSFLIAEQRIARDQLAKALK